MPGCRSYLVVVVNRCLVVSGYQVVDLISCLLSLSNAIFTRLFTHTLEIINKENFNNHENHDNHDNHDNLTTMRTAITMRTMKTKISVTTNSTYYIIP